MREHRGAGFVAIEWVAAVTVLLMPAVVLGGSLPRWAERRHAATVAAREAVRELEREWPNLDAARAELVARYVAAEHGVDSSDVTVRINAGHANPGDQLRVEVSVSMPAIVLPGLARAASWTYTASGSARIDDYRSR
jgi:citrate lyase beta subunit